MFYYQAKVQVQVQSLKSKFKVKSKSLKSQRTWTLLTVLSYSPPPTTHHITFQTLPEVLQSSVIPFWKPLMTLY